MTLHFALHLRNLPLLLLALLGLHPVAARLAAAPLAADWQPTRHGRWLALTVPQSDRVGFVSMDPAATGLQFTNALAAERYLTNTMLLNGSGVAAGDVDGDGWCDLYFCTLDGSNALFRNLGNWRFENITTQAGVALRDVIATGAVLADIDNDRDLDLIVNSFWAGTLAFLNDGRGRFTPQPASPPLNVNAAAMSLGLADVEPDGDLDLYVANYRTWTIRDRPDTKLSIELQQGKPVVVRVADRPVTEPDLAGRFTVGPTGSFDEHGEADVFCLNNGSGVFSPVSFTSGAFLDEAGRPLRAPPYDWGLSVMFRDLNGDRRPDLYVCNDFDSPDRFWINQGNGVFQLAPPLALRSTSIFSMGMDVADVNRDGWDDFLVVDMLSRHHQKRQVQVGTMKPVPLNIGEIEDRPQYSRNTLFVNRGDGTYAELGMFAGVQASEWSWTPAFIDVDLDGFEDLLVTAGHEMDAMNADVVQRAEDLKARQRLSPLEQLQLRRMFARLEVPKAAFLNRGDLTFEEVGEAWGFATRAVSHGLALADLDNDGDLDAIVSNLNGRAELFRNQGSAPRVAVRLRGSTSNSRGIGAQIQLKGGRVPLQTQTIVCGGRYLSSDDAERVFAANTNSQPMELSVQWPTGRTTVLADVRANRRYEVYEPEAAPAPPPDPASALRLPSTTSTAPTLFEDISQQLSHMHYETPFDDFLNQPLLPHRFSQLGPGVLWNDFNDDGWEDLVIASGRGGQLAVFYNNQQGGFKRADEPWLGRLAGRDQTALVAVGHTLFAGTANFEDGTTNGGWVAIFDFERKASGQVVLGPVSSTGPLALADVDGDGDLDLFIGGRLNAGRYPEAATSLLLRNDGGSFAPIQRWSGTNSLGLVSAATFADLSGDGIPELVVACDWGPVRVLHKTAGGFEEIPSSLGLAPLRGRWNGVAAGDFDGDGRLDLVASNWGRNHRLAPLAKDPLRIVYGDFDDNGSMDAILSRHDPELDRQVPIPSLNALRGALPFLEEASWSYEAFGRAGIQDILGERWSKARQLEATTLDSMLFLNRGGRFEARTLPTQAQWAPGFGVCVSDFDGDGHQDVFLAQNFFAVRADDARHDAGIGLVLRGDGLGGFEALACQQTGIRVYGEQRGCAAADFDRDGRVDLVVAQNGAATKLFHNRHAAPGLRVRLRGPATNPYQIGAQLRLKFGNRFGPVTEVQAGGGYWSQNPQVSVLATPTVPTQLWIRWLGGATSVLDVPAGAREVAVTP
jgi:hypothetical protein